MHGFVVIVHEHPGENLCLALQNLLFVKFFMANLIHQNLHRKYMSVFIVFRGHEESSDSI